MRISTANAFEASVDSLQKRQKDLSEAQAQLTSGKRVLRASDDPTAAARAERALATSARSDASMRALEASRNALTLGESALADAGELLQQIRETLVQAGNASYSDAERSSLADKVAGLRAQLLAAANRGDGAGGYLFGGQGASLPPFLDAPGGVQYRGTRGEIQVAMTEQMPLTLDGAATWLQARTGNGVFQTAPMAGNAGNAWIDAGRVTDPGAVTGSTYTLQFSVSGGSTTYTVLRDGNPTALTNLPYQSGKAIEIDGMAFSVNGAPANGDRFETTPSAPTLSVFDTIDRVVAELKTPSRASGQIAQTVNSGLRDIDQSMSTLNSARARVGELLNLSDGAESRLDDLKLYAQSERSNAEDLDMVQAISDFQGQQSGYDAALKTYAMVQKMSLFEYIG
ncbi:MAG: flagellar hook-associated protein FlgL [Pseudomonadota bacterium]